MDLREKIDKLYCEWCYEGLSDRCSLFRRDRPCEYAHKIMGKALTLIAEHIKNMEEDAHKNGLNLTLSVILKELIGE